nr:protein TESPA1 [Columba livia]
MSLWSPHVTALMSLQGDPPPGAAAMEGTSVLSPSWWEKRRAWARQSRSWRPTAPDEDDVAPNEDDVAPDEDEVAPATRHVPELPAPDLDDVFLEGSPSRKIETWLQEGGSLVEEPGSPGPLGCGNNGTSFEDDLTLGAEALLLLGSHEVTGRAPRDKPPSVASSGLSSLPTKTSCSVVAVTRGCPPRSRLKKVVSTMSLYVSPRNGDSLGDKDNLWDGDNPAGQGEHQLDAAAGVTLSPALGPPSPYTKDPQDSMGTCSPSPDTPRTGGHRSGNRHLGGPLKDTGHPPGKVPVSPCPHWQESGDSFELEELPSTSEDDDDDNEGDTHEESGRSLCPSITIRRRTGPS